MAIEKDDHGNVTITGEHIDLFHLMRLTYGLALEINTGMKVSSRGSTMKAAKAACGSMRNTKVRVLADLVAYTREKFPEYRPAPSVEKALKTVKGPGS